jgi:HEAT repeat protein
MEHHELVDHYIEDLKSCDLDTRMNAIKHLRELGDARAVQHLVVTALNYQGPYSEFEEIRDTLQNFPEQAVKSLIDALERKDVGDCRYAAQLLGAFRDKRAIAPLLNALDEHSQESGGMSALSLAEYGEAVIDPLIERVESHPNPSVRRNAMLSLSSIASRRVARFAEQKLNDPVVRVMALKALGNPDTVNDMAQRLSIIIPFLESESVSERRSAVLALGRLRDERAIPHLVKLLDDLDGSTKSNTILALGWIGSPKAVEPLIARLEDGTDKMQVAEALGNIGDPRAIEPLLSILDSSNYDTRYRINEALKQLGHHPEDYVHEPITEDEMIERRRQTLNITLSLLDAPNLKHRETHFQSLKFYVDIEPKIVNILMSGLQDEEDLTVKRVIVDALYEIREAQEPCVQERIDEALQQVELASLPPNPFSQKVSNDTTDC